MSDQPTDGEQRTPLAAPRAIGVWGLGEALLAWTMSIFVSTALYLGLLTLGDYSALSAHRPGGHIGRTTAQVVSQEDLRNDAVPLIWQMLTLVPGWILLLGVAWISAGMFNHARPGWSLRGTPGDVSIGIAGGLILQVPVMVIVAILMQAILGDFAPSGRALTLIDSIESPLAVVVLFLAVAVGAPIAEELFYRGLIQGSLVDRFGPVIGIGVSSIIFGAVHLSWIEFAPLTIAGLGFGLLAWKRGRVLPAIIAHITFNTFTLILLFSTTL
jgi:membrane protease YdiL (CAAX protease family)